MSEYGHVDVVFSPQTGGYSYVCELSEMGRTFSAVVTSSTVTCNVSAVSISQAERESPVRLVWRNGPMNFTIESSTVTDQRGLFRGSPTDFVGFMYILYCSQLHMSAPSICVVGVRLHIFTLLGASHSYSN